MSRSLVRTVHLWPPGQVTQCTGSSRKLAGRLTDRALSRGAWLIQVQLQRGGADRASGDVMTGPMFPEDSWVEVRYPLTREQEHADRAIWPWLPGWVVSVCGPDEWEVCVQAPELATSHDGEDWYSTCFRDSSEIRLPEAQADLEWPAGPELEAQ